MRHLWTTNKDNTSPKAYVEQSFSRALDDYSVDYAYNNGLKLSYDGNFTDINSLDLKQIELQQGYYLCSYDGHTGTYLFICCDSKLGAKAAYKQLYMRCFRHAMWYWIVKVD